MTSDQIRTVLDRVLSWPPSRQEEAVAMLLLLEAQGDETYMPSADEQAAIEEGMAEARRGEFATDEEMAAIWKRFGE